MRGQHGLGDLGRLVVALQAGHKLEGEFDCGARALGGDDVVRSDHSIRGQVRHRVLEACVAGGGPIGEEAVVLGEA